MRGRKIFGHKDVLKYQQFKLVCSLDKAVTSKGNDVLVMGQHWEGICQCVRFIGVVRERIWKPTTLQAGIIDVQFTAGVTITSINGNNTGT